MKKLYILGEDIDWNIPIYEALKQKNIEYELWNLCSENSSVHELNQTPKDGIYFNRLSPSAHIRGNNNAYYFALTIIYMLESYGLQVINGSSATQWELNKIKQYAELNKKNIKTPKTYFSHGLHQAKETCEALGYPLIIKPNIGGSGQGVTLIQEPSQLDHAIKEIYSTDGVFIFQEYIKPVEQYIVRSEFIGQEYLYSVKVRIGDSFNLCPADGCSMEEAFCPTSGQPTTETDSSPKFEIFYQEPKDIDKYIQIMKEQNIQIAGIEYVTDANGVDYTYDINTNTNYNKTAELKVEFSAYDRLAEFLKSKL